MNVSRRRFLQTAATLIAADGISTSSFGQVCPAKEGTVRDRIWIFANPVNADYNFVRKRSVMTPLEACVYMGAPNLLMVNQYPAPEPKTTFTSTTWPSPAAPSGRGRTLIEAAPGH